jgi:hypothetical protein
MDTAQSRKTQATETAMYAPPFNLLSISPIFKADSVTLAVLREKNAKLRVVYAGSHDAKVGSAGRGAGVAGKLAGGRGADLTPAAGQALTLCKDTTAAGRSATRSSRIPTPIA